MELTTSYQKLGETYLMTDDYGGKLYVRIYAKYSEQDISNNKTKVQYEARYYFDKSWNVYDRNSRGTVSGTDAETLSFSKSSDYTGGEHTLGTTEAWVTHNSDGTKTITTSAFLNFPNWGKTATATGTATLPTLHKSPLLIMTAMTEANSSLNNRNVDAKIIVQHLSNKTFTSRILTYDNATLSEVKIYHNGTELATGTITNVTSSNYRVTFTIDFANVGELIELNNVYVFNGEGSVKTADIATQLQLVAKDSLNATKTTNVNFEMIKYIKPTYDNAQTFIRRFTGYSSELQQDITLTDNKVGANLLAYRYAGNDRVGSSNNIIVKYKIWERDATEPTNYSNLGSTSAASYQLTDKIISNIDYLKVYRYKISIRDVFISDGVIIKEGEISTGVPVWSEYKDHVDFLAITRQGNDVYSNVYSTNEIIVGKWIDDKPIYRKVINVGQHTWSNAIHSFAHNVSNIGIVLRSQWIGYYDNRWYYSWDNLTAQNITINSTDIIINCSSSTITFNDNYFILEYTKS